MSAPVMRASDQDREEAVLALSDHFAEGRLDHEEFESRMALAQQATYLHDLDPLFADLPSRARRGDAVAAARPRPSWRPGRRSHVVPFVLLAVLTAILLTQGHAVWLLIPLWWIGFSVARRRAWQRRAWAHAEIGPHGPHHRHGWNG